MKTTFAELGLTETSLHALVRAGFERPTPIQAQAIPPALAGRDVIGTAATGTGKTAAFLLPIIERLSAQPGPRGPRALVLAPTRELALQIEGELVRFGRGRHVRGAAVIGGVGMARQAEELRDHEVVVATPGRLVDHLQQGNARLDRIEVLVLDEADRMLDMGFKPQLDRILGRLPRKRQTLLFSATKGGEVADFARTHLHDPVTVEVARSGTTAERAEQRVFLADQQEKLPLLLALLGDDELSTLVFTRTKRRADKVWKALDRAGFKVARIHADRSQAQRKMALEGFRDGQYRILVATDIAARGIDVAENRPRRELRPPPRGRGLRPPRGTHGAARGQRARLGLRGPGRGGPAPRDREAHPQVAGARRGAARLGRLPGGAVARRRLARPPRTGRNARRDEPEPQAGRGAQRAAEHRPALCAPGVRGAGRSRRARPLARRAPDRRERRPEAASRRVLGAEAAPVSPRTVGAVSRSRLHRSPLGRTSNS